MRQLKAFIFEQNDMNRLFSNYRHEPAELYPEDLLELTPADIKSLRQELEGALSPENLTCDGELDSRSVAAKYYRLKLALDQLNELS